MPSPDLTHSRGATTDELARLGGPGGGGVPGVALWWGRQRAQPRRQDGQRSVSELGRYCCCYAPAVPCFEQVSVPKRAGVAAHLCASPHLASRPCCSSSGSDLSQHTKRAHNFFPSLTGCCSEEGAATAPWSRQGGEEVAASIFPVPSEGWDVPCAAGGGMGHFSAPLSPPRAARPVPHMGAFSRCQCVFKG